MAIVRRSLAGPTACAPLPRLLAFVETLGLERWLDRPKRGVPTLALALLWLVLAWRQSGRPTDLDHLDEPLLPALLGLDRRPCGRTLRRSLARFSARGLRRAVEQTAQTALTGRSERLWAALDAHQLPYWGRGQRDRLKKGWSGSHSRRLRGYRLYLAVDTVTGLVLTFVLARGNARDQRFLLLLARRLRQLYGRRLAGVVADCGFTSKASVAAMLQAGIPFILGFARSKPIKARLAALSGQQRRHLREGSAIWLGACAWDTRLRLFALPARTTHDRRGPWVYVTNVHGHGPQWLATTYRQRWRVEQAFEELLHGNDLDHLVSTHLAPNRVAVGFRLLARNLALAFQLASSTTRILREPKAFRAAQVDGLGTFERTGWAIRVITLAPTSAATLPLPWSRSFVNLVA